MKGTKRPKKIVNWTQSLGDPLNDCHDLQSNSRLNYDCNSRTTCFAIGTSKSKFKSQIYSFGCEVVKVKITNSKNACLNVQTRVIFGTLDSTQKS